MIGTMLVLTHFILRKLGLTNCELPPGWPAYVCNTHEGGARTTSASVTSTASVPVAATGAASLPAAATAPPPAAAPAASAATQALGKPSIHQQSIAQLEPLAAAIPQPPPCITIPNPPYPGSPCPPSKYPPYEPMGEQKMPFVIDNAAPTPGLGQRTGHSTAQATAATATPAAISTVGARATAAATAPTGADVPFNMQPKDNCVTITASGVAVPCNIPGPKKDVGKGPTASVVGGGKSNLNQPSQPATSPSKAAPAK